MTSEVDLRAPERTVEVSETALAQIFPGMDLGAPSRPVSWLGRFASGLRIRLRLIWTRLRFRFDDFRALRLFWTGCRLRLRLLWIRVRYRNKLSK